MAKAVDAILAGVPPLTLKEKIGKLETRKAGLTQLLTEVPDDVPDLLPSAAAIYGQKVERLAAASMSLPPGGKRRRLCGG